MNDDLLGFIGACVFGAIAGTVTSVVIVLLVAIAWMLAQLIPGTHP